MVSKQEVQKVYQKNAMVMRGIAKRARYSSRRKVRTVGRATCACAGLTTTAEL